MNPSTVRDGAGQAIIDPYPTHLLEALPYLP